MGQSVIPAQTGPGRPRLAPLPEFAGNPWDRQPEGVFGPRGESQLAYARFAEYFLMGPARTLEAVATKLGVKPATIRQMATVHAWEARCRAYDVRLAQEQLDDIWADAARVHVERHAAGNELIEWAQKGILGRDAMDEKLADVLKVRQEGDRLVMSTLEANRRLHDFAAANGITINVNVFAGELDRWFEVVMAAVASRYGDDPGAVAAMLAEAIAPKVIPGEVVP